jgi:thiamine biosynthesis lipoprotein
MEKSYVELAIVVAFFLRAGLCDAGAELRTFTHDAMGSEFSFTISSQKEETDVRAMVDEAFAAVDALDERMSLWRANSEISKVNARAAFESVSVSKEVADLIMFCQKTSKETQGAFDVTIGPLSRLWGFADPAHCVLGKGAIPSDDEIRCALGLVGSDKVKLDASRGSLSFAHQGVALDFGGVGKGLALDLAADVLKRRGLTSAILSAGSSSMVAFGAPPGESGWSVRIRDPRGRGESMEEVVLHDDSLSTSGGYEKFFKAGGKRYCHIIDPRLGRPVEGIVGVTVIGPTGVETDALSTAFFVMGENGTRDYCTRRPDIKAIIASEDKSSGGTRVSRIGD